MASVSQDVADAEVAVGKMLRQRRASATRDLTDLRFPRGTSANFGTVQKRLKCRLARLLAIEELTDNERSQVRANLT